jgi:hypothetical protein
MIHQRMDFTRAYRPRACGVLLFRRHLHWSRLFRLDLIQNVTKILTSVLTKRTSLSKFSIDERMSWIESRKTTREEDLAYCLFGIFDVQLPQLYGEGRYKAFDRLKREIAKPLGIEILMKLKRTRVLSHPSNFDPISIQQAKFVGRDSYLSRIDQAFDDAACPMRLGAVGLHGLGGMGRSQIAMRYVYSRKSSFNNILRAAVGDSECLHQSLGTIAGSLGLLDTSEDGLGLASCMFRVKNWLDEGGEYL